jgi:DNA-binding MarR family transcriptional regulator
VSTVVARLVEQGLVSRQTVNHGSSQLELVLTARGRRLATKTTGTAQGALDRVHLRRCRPGLATLWRGCSGASSTG